ncbi:hypothetical protein MIR68_007052 [Amoeboaphelidium protococcarum]|nr:hypothetical protein MIR68_007052 [Amoeboaphelidium protococcarum]
MENIITENDIDFYESRKLPLPVRNQEQLKEWKLKRPDICCICFKAEQTTDNPILKCSDPSCDVQVHAKCFGISPGAIPSQAEVQQWLCEKCRLGEHSAYCALCPNLGGALKQTKKKNVWIHILCAMWIPEVTFQNVDFLSGIETKYVPQSRFNRYCCLCANSHLAGIGACIDCSYEEFSAKNRKMTCGRSFHVTCASRYNLLNDAAQFNSEHSSSDYDADEHIVYCNVHRFGRYHAELDHDSCINAWDSWRVGRYAASDVLTGDQIREQESLKIFPIPPDENDTFECEHGRSAIPTNQSKNERSCLKVLPQLKDINSPCKPLWLNDQRRSDESVPNLSVFCNNRLPGQSDQPPQINYRVVYVGLKNGQVCGKCYTRCLPKTAPVLPQYRDFLLKCCVCSQSYHLCCLDTPTMHPPSDDDSSDSGALQKYSTWKCDKCQSQKSQRQSNLLKDVNVMPTVKELDSAEKKPKRIKFDSINDSDKCITSQRQEVSVATLADKCAPIILLNRNISSYFNGGDGAIRGPVFVPLEVRDWYNLLLYSAQRVILNCPPDATHSGISMLTEEIPRQFILQLLEAHCSRNQGQPLLPESTFPCQQEGNQCHLKRSMSEESFASAPSELADNVGDNSPLVKQRLRWKVNSQSKMMVLDLYKPIWTRYSGRDKEGWCGLCQPGTWLKVKTSVYWYHMHYFHGVSSITGTFYEPPTAYRLDEKGSKEGRCGNCNQWISIQGEKHINVQEIHWYRHCQQCHDSKLP